MNKFVYFFDNKTNMLKTNAIIYIDLYNYRSNWISGMRHLQMLLLIYSHPMLPHISAQTNYSYSFLQSLYNKLIDFCFHDVQPIVRFYFFIFLIRIARKQVWLFEVTDGNIPVPPESEQFHCNGG